MKLCQKMLPLVKPVNTFDQPFNKFLVHPIPKTPVPALKPI